MCVDVMVMSSVYEVSCSGAGGWCMFDVHMGKRTPLCLAHVQRQVPILTRNCM